MKNCKQIYRFLILLDNFRSHNYVIFRMNCGLSRPEVITCGRIAYIINSCRLPHDPMFLYDCETSKIKSPDGIENFFFKSQMSAAPQFPFQKTQVNHFCIVIINNSYL